MDCSNHFVSLSLASAIYAFLAILSCADAESIQLKDGRILKNAVLTRHTELDSTFRYDAGMAKVPNSQLPEDLRIKLDEPRKAKELQAKELEERWKSIRAISVTRCVETSRVRWFLTVKIVDNRPQLNFFSFYIDKDAKSKERNSMDVTASEVASLRVIISKFQEWTKLAEKNQIQQIKKEIGRLSEDSFEFTRDGDSMYVHGRFCTLFKEDFVAIDSLLSQLPSISDEVIKMIADTSKIGEFK